MSKRYFTDSDNIYVARLSGTIAEYYDFASGTWKFDENLYERIDENNNLIKISETNAKQIIHDREKEHALGIKYPQGAEAAKPKEMKRSENAGCYYCLKVFPVYEIEEYIREADGSMTPVCPYCGIDSLIFDNSLTDNSRIISQEELEFLHESQFC